jgi:hypothetical protein
MKALVRLVALLTALLLVSQPGWAMRGCDQPAESTAPAHQHDAMPGMPVDHQSQHSAPAGQHGFCDLALCRTMTSCGPTALVTAVTPLATPPEAGFAPLAWLATSSPVGPDAPELPPPRA